MDAYSISCTSPHNRSSSRIYQDLKAMASRLHSLIEPDPEHPNQIHSGMMDKENTRPEDADRPHIGIVGGGLAGLRCADVLLQHGFRVTLIEGRNRLGGRVQQVQLGNFTVDMGPNWIHGTDSNPILDLARRTSTDTSSFDAADSGQAVVDENGQTIDSAEAARLSGVLWEIVLAAFKHSNRDDGDESGELDPAKSLLDFFRERVPEAIPESVEGFEWQRKIVLQMAQFWGSFVGSPVERQSLKFFWLEECIEGGKSALSLVISHATAPFMITSQMGNSKLTFKVDVTENLFCAGTYSKILQTVAKPALKSAEILLNTVVTKIQTETSTTDGPKTVLTTSTGLTHSFDTVVVTCPLGWLKSHTSAFSPPLPQRMRSAINSLGYGTLEKVYINFPEPFWRSAPSPPKGFLQWLSPSYASDTNPHRWTIEAVELASLSPPGTAHATLLFYLYGDISAHIQALTSTSESRAKAERLVTEFFQPYFSRLPGYSSTLPSCQPSAVTWTTWSQDELAGNGSYTNFQVGLQAGDEDVCALREYVGDAEANGGGLYLAGEHTAPFVALGTSTGAYWSGEAVAGKVAERWGRASSTGKTEQVEASGRTEGET